MEEKELTTEEMLEMVVKYREEEGKRLASMTKEERIADFKKTQDETIKLAEELNMEIIRPKNKK